MAERSVPKVHGSNVQSQSKFSHLSSACKIGLKLRKSVWIMPMPMQTFLKARASRLGGFRGLARRRKRSSLFFVQLAAMEFHEVF